jgi:DNA-binding NtrC family response regulator
MKKNILVIDDEEIFLDLIKSYLETKNYEVTTSLSGQHILKLLFAKRYDAVLLDVWMVDKSGVEILKEINKANPKLPVIMMTGYTASSLEDSLKGLNAAGFVTKPFKLAELGALVAKVTSDETDDVSIDSNNVSVDGNNSNEERINESATDSESEKASPAIAENVKQ